MRISKTLSRLIWISFVLNALHFLEVLATGFASNAYLWIGNSVGITSLETYLLLHIPLYLALVIVFLFLKNSEIFRLFLLGYTWLFISESHHFLHAIWIKQYYSGAVTSFLYIILGLLYVLQLRKEHLKLIHT